MSSEAMVKELAREVLKRLAPALGADGRRGRLVVVFSGGTAGLGEALAQTRALGLAGFELGLCLTPGARALYGELVGEGLAWLPGTRELDPANWLAELQASRGVVAPALSLNLLSRLATLMPDSPAANYLLHGLMLGKPVVLARDGVDPDLSGRRELGFDRGGPALDRALRERLATAAELGFRLCRAAELKRTVLAALGTEGTAAAAGGSAAAPATGGVLVAPPGVVTADLVRRAFAQGVRLALPAGARLTPLAVDEAGRLGVALARA